MIQERVKLLSEVGATMQYFWEEVPYEATALLPQKKGAPLFTPAETARMLRTVRDEAARGEFRAADMEARLRPLVEGGDWGVKELFMTLRVAVTGRTVSAPLFETMEVLGREESLRRLDRAIAKLA
jgi:glutamyl-tRNA synthetase